MTTQRCHLKLHTKGIHFGVDTPVTYVSISLLNQLILKDIGKLNMKVIGYTLGLVTSVSMLQLNNVI